MQTSTTPLSPEGIRNAVARLRRRMAVSMISMMHDMHDDMTRPRRGGL